MDELWLNRIAEGLALVSSVLFYWKRSLIYLQFFQQEDYTAKRYGDWYWRRRAWDRRASIFLLAAIVCLCFVSTPIFSFPISVASALVLASIALSAPDPRLTGKIKLKMTARAKRIYNLAFLFFSVALMLIVLATETIGRINGRLYWQEHVLLFFWLGQLVLIQTAALWIVIANLLLTPYEQSVQEKFANEARTLLNQYGPTVIGITGSYGKTSTKVLLKDILSSVSPTFSTPGSINSYMGVTREIREHLQPHHKFAIIEMGAYYIGSIKKMCSLTPPQAAIVTTIGIMHLERFGGEQAVYQAKSELAQALPADGILVVNGDNELCRQMAKENPKRVTLFYGLDEGKGHLDSFMYDIRASENGSSFKIRWQDEVYEGFAGLLGRPMLGNVLAAFTMSCALGMPPAVVLAALRNVRTEPNRLEPVRTDIGSLSAGNNGTACRSGKILRLNDAYNSNPVGFDAALEVLANIPGGRRILVTPGMIELGERQEKENQDVAKKAATICDLVCIVGDTNRNALISGLHAAGMPSERYKEFADMLSALAYLSDQFCQDGDIVLIENDLPDLFESKVSF